MRNILQWNSVDKEKWTYHFQSRECTFLVYRLTKLPDFTEHRFSYLCKEEDGRAAEVAKKQLQM